VLTECVVQDSCLAFALEHPEETEFGVWGGTTPRQREQLQKQFGRSENAYVG
jgi:hypothetical protein